VQALSSFLLASVQDDYASDRFDENTRASLKSCGYDTTISKDAAAGQQSASWMKEVSEMQIAAPYKLRGIHTSSWLPNRIGDRYPYCGYLSRVYH
jgi:hypothetical protein